MQDESVEGATANKDYNFSWPQRNDRGKFKEAVRGFRSEQFDVQSATRHQG
ncbi:hypothetical protein Poly30_08830 [Planctomycetes bacterium Poly30]|uniref:Uncharacterized protein n=1 Tax=Saltatorellus ferox TaxID=2528018 RepID=A0A518EMS7_9BACT|nr:hypothetical protein Poly30_08830 [Planctomycetes bacterium Poly30]